MSRALDIWRRTGRVTLLDKLDDVACVEELDGMSAELSARGVVLGRAEAEAFARRRVELQRGAGR
jgi:hypothetical protein